MSLEITKICAEVSLHRHENHYTTIYKRFPGGFEILKAVPGIATIKNTFTKDSEFKNDDQRRDFFWKLKCAVSCTRLTTALLDICKRLDDKGVTLVHQGCKVTNVFAVNGGTDISGLEHLKLRTQGSSKDEKYEVGMYCTIINKQKTSVFPKHIRELLDRVHYRNDEYVHIENVANYLKIPIEKFVPHWWACFTLENGTSIHVDLCGPAYDLFNYERTLSGQSAPVYITTVSSLIIVHHVCNTFPGINSGAKKYPHKLHMTTRSIKDDICVKLTPCFRPFVFAEQINMEITPVDALLVRTSNSCFENASEIVGLLFLYCLQHSLELCCKEGLSPPDMEIYAKISGINAQKELNGQVLKLHSIVNERVAVIKKDGNIIKVLPSKIVLVGGQSQIITLKEMKALCDADIDQGIKEINEDINEGDIIIIMGLTKAITLNGLKGRVIKDCREHISTMLPDDRFVIQLSETKEQKSITRNNLSVVEKAVVSDKQKIKEIKDYFENDSGGQLFFQRIITTKNFGLTALTDPEILPAFERLVQMGLGSHLCGSVAQQRVFEQMIEIAKMEDFTKFRVVMQILRSGIAPEQYERLVGSNPQIQKIFDKCEELGIFKPRLSQK